MILDLNTFDEINVTSDNMKEYMVKECSLKEIEDFRDMLFVEYNNEIKAWQSMDYKIIKFDYLENVVNSIAYVQQTCRDYEKITETVLDRQEFSEFMSSAVKEIAASLESLTNSFRLAEKKAK